MGNSKDTKPEPTKKDRGENVCKMFSDLARYQKVFSMDVQSKNNTLSSNNHASELEGLLGDLEDRLKVKKPWYNSPSIKVKQIQKSIG